MKKMIFAVLLFASQAFAQEMIDKSYTATSKNPNANEARREIQEQISQQATEELAKQILGENRFQKNRAAIMGKIAKSSARYIPFQKQGSLESNAEGFTMTATMKVNAQAFKQLLQQAGLLNENESAPVLLPMVQVVDRIQGRSDRWWTPGSSEVSTPLRGFSRNLEASLRGSFAKAGFFVIRPVSASLGEATPVVLRTERHTPEDLKTLGDWFGSPLVIEGTLQIGRPREGSAAAAKLDLRLQVIQTADNRPIADVTRSFETDPGPLDVVVDRKLKDIGDTVAGDLASQVAEAWQKGALGSSQIRLNLTQKLPLQDIEKFKQALTSSSLGLRSVRERLISTSGIVFEVESPASLEDLSSRMQGFSFGGRRLQAQVADGEIRLQFARE